MGRRMSDDHEDARTRWTSLWSVVGVDVEKQDVMVRVEKTRDEGRGLRLGGGWIARSRCCAGGLLSVQRDCEGQECCTDAGWKEGCGVEESRRGGRVSERSERWRQVPRQA